MCGIIAVIRRRSDRRAPGAEEVLEPLDRARQVLAAAAPQSGSSAEDVRRGLDDAAERVESVDRLLRGTPGVLALIGDRGLIGQITAAVSLLDRLISGIDGVLDDDTGFAVELSDLELEQVNAALVRLKDAVWAVGHDRVRNARSVASLAGPDAGLSAIEAFTSVQTALSALDRLEVRGRDSAGIHLLVRDHGLDLSAATTMAAMATRAADPLFGSGSVREADGCLSFVYKAAAEIGELGDNTRALREAIAADDLLARALATDTAQATVLGHTRWASVGIISEPNAHPLNSEEVGEDAQPYAVAALNGDVDNFADLKVGQGLHIAPEITTDAKVIPTLLSRRLAAGDHLVEGFRRTVTGFHGSVAIAANAVTDPSRLLLALRGSGQALYVGLTEDAYVVASEPYGVIEECDRYLRLDGETPADRQDATGSQGQIASLDGAQAGTVEGIERVSYSGQRVPVEPDELVASEITTRDIDRGTYPHFLLKEISESPTSFRKTLRGKIVERAGRLTTHLGLDSLPADVRAGLADGAIKRVMTVGQGTAAVAAQSLARALGDATSATGLRVEAALATELSGFGLSSDLSDTLVVAISQSGTTTDTNRTVDLVRSRGAHVVSIVNRRNSDLTDKSDGVLYTSDGRDVEMSVASTKAFYSQVAAGFVLAFAIAEVVLAGPGADLSDDVVERAVAERAELLAGLRDLPTAMTATLGRQPAIAVAAQQLAPAKRYWALVGSGPDFIAAQELRIKLSELCYKSIACDHTEDKKHIDLSCEPLILVCAAGLVGSNADDVAKEVAIYRAHKASPVVIATEGEDRFAAALQALTVPAVHPKLAFVLTTVVGHLFGYEAALAIDAQAVPLREARAAIERTVASAGPGDGWFPVLGQELEPLAHAFLDGVRAGSYNGHLEAATALRLASLFRYATGVLPLDLYQVELGRVGTPSVLVQDLTAALTAAIDELTRPVDAIKHQAKTVTVGISRSDEGLLQVPLVHEVLEIGTGRDRLSYTALRTLAGLDAAVAEVVGFTRYRIDGRVEDGGATIAVIDRGGIALDLPLRTASNPMLRGTKHRVATEREVTVAVGRSDGRTLVLVPEVKGNQCTGLTLLHVALHDRVPATAARSVLERYRNRYSALKDAVTETEPAFRDDLLGEMSLTELLTVPVNVLADRWRSS